MKLAKRIGKFLLCESIGIILTSIYFAIFSIIYKIENTEVLMDAYQWSMIFLTFVVFPLLVSEIISIIRKTPNLVTKAVKEDIPTLLTAFAVLPAALTLIFATIGRLIFEDTSYALLGFSNIILLIVTLIIGCMPTKETLNIQANKKLSKSLNTKITRNMKALTNKEIIQSTSVLTDTEFKTLNNQFNLNDYLNNRTVYNNLIKKLNKLQEPVIKTIYNYNLVKVDLGRGKLVTEDSEVDLNKIIKMEILEGSTVTNTTTITNSNSNINGGQVITKTKKSAASAITRGVVGGALFGPIGALAGATTASSKSVTNYQPVNNDSNSISSTSSYSETNYTLIFYTSDFAIPTIRVNSTSNTILVNALHGINNILTNYEAALQSIEQEKTKYNEYLNEKEETLNHINKVVEKIKENLQYCERN